MAPLKSIERYPNCPPFRNVPIYTLKRTKLTPWISRMASSGVTRVLFHSKKDVEPSDVEACRNAGLETAIACPMMLLGKGIHRFHKFLAGV